MNEIEFVKEKFNDLQHSKHGAVFSLGKDAYIHERATEDGIKTRLLLPDKNYNITKYEDVHYLGDASSITDAFRESPASHLERMMGLSLGVWRTYSYTNGLSKLGMQDLDESIREWNKVASWMLSTHEKMDTALKATTKDMPAPIQDMGFYLATNSPF